MVFECDVRLFANIKCCSCNQGYFGKYCERYQCPCLNGGSCILSNPLVCRCLPGFTGIYCEQVVKARSHICFDYKLCGEHGRCKPTGGNYGDYRCDCYDGFQGRRCERNTGICGSGGLVCQNGGTCMHGENGCYKCKCVSGWEGEHCERDVDDCKSALCASGSQCIDRVASYECICPTGKTGVLCNIDDPCVTKNPCKEGSDCIVDRNTGEYQCRCRSGFTGQDCSVDINECETLNISCGNKGICINTRGSWRCQCNEGYFGVFCETAASRCLPDSCKNGGSCLDYRFKFECICAEGFYGKYCELKCPDGYGGSHCTIRRCNDTNCLNGGSCLNGLCRCPPLYYGDFCQSLISNPCKRNPCPRDRVCSPSANGVDYVCTCPSGFFGNDCKDEITACSQKPCKNGGKCVENNGSFVCQCELEYYGKHCEYNSQDNCYNKPCLNGGTCVLDNFNASFCKCPALFSGRFCQNQSSQSNHRCQNNGTCVYVSNSNDCICQCSSGFTGTYCENDINECEIKDVCFNGGTCHNTFGSFYCTCLFGYTGRVCENKQNSCVSDICLNGGKCIETRNGFLCHCSNEFYGERCEKSVVENCDVISCRNGGSCIRDLNTIRCHCLNGFTGQFCEKAKSQCFTGLCLNNGSCVQYKNTYHCICQPGYTGKNCQQLINYEQFTQLDARDINRCRLNNCEKKAGNGKCDKECNYFACNYDSGDCSANSQPFSKCKYASFCAHSFRDGQCNPICNNEECLFDGYDCEKVFEKCSVRDFCSKVSGDGICNKLCNNSSCSWDGGDCSEFFKDSKVLSGDIRLVILIPPEEFIKRVRQFITTLSQLLRTPVRIRTDFGKPLIYEWDSVNGAGKVVMDISNRNIEQFFAGYHNRSKRMAVLLTGTLIVLQVNADFCRKSEQLSCFSDISSVVNYLAALTAKQFQLFSDFNMPLYSVSARIHQDKKVEGLFTVSAMLLVFGFAFVTLLYTVGGQSRKRNCLRAPVWMPPLGSSESVCSKRFRSELDSSVTQFEKMTETDSLTLCGGCHDDERQWSELHMEAMLETAIALPIEPTIVNAKGKWGQTPLMLVILNKSKANHVAETDIRSLLEAGADINLCDDDGTTPLMLAIKTAKFHIVDLLLANGANSGLADNCGRTALHHAVALEMPEIVEALLKTAVDINAADCNNQTALIYSARFAFNSVIAKALLKAEADPTCVGNKLSPKYNGRTALHYAAQYNNLDVIKTLVENGADINAQDQKEQTPLFLAAMEGKVDAVRMLISLGAAEGIGDENQRTPRDIAAEKMYNGITEFLDKVRTLRTSKPEANEKSLERRNLSAITKKYNKRVGLKSSLPNNLNKCISKNTTPLTPPLSDTSNYSGTSSPGAFYSNNVGFIDQTLHSCSVMLSPQFENNQCFVDEGGPETCLYQVEVP
uniref:Delta-like protein n=1 Tax=Syphacia muris TaxID=451379 RepID=A0A0N5A9Z5_9BILA